ncbi:MAG: ATP-dependent helicase, partial [Salinibacterium sp.]|nr:ATP-dependent helicase [Salinibacterium sp.]
MISSLELAARLGQPQPTAQQQAVIEAPLSPALVTAGAGSGKTSTMANRVVWLLANELIRPDQVLGLTFTRKAAGSLSDRIAQGITALRGSASLSAGTAAEFEQPTVSTYNAFASALFRDNALLIGREPESALLNEAAAWQLARRVVVASTDDRLVSLGQSVDTLAEWVLSLAHAMSDNDADASAVARFAEGFAAIAELPYTAGKNKPVPYATVTTAVSHVAALGPLTELAIEFALQKKRSGLLEFSDQVALALEVVVRSAAVRAEYRDRYRVVLVDEYQDTSVGQTRLLSALFADTAVMAVGDPHQSIYGWRGASAANLARFAHDFAEGSASAAFSLSVSWRNATSILDAANVLVAPLNALGAHAAGSPLAVASLEPRPAAPAGAVTGWYFEEVTEEADGVAKWFKTQLVENGAGGKPKSAAILFRQRRQMTLFANALADHGVPHHVLGIGGLLSTPEIVDLVSALRVLHDPTAGSALVRLLGGARWAIGSRDLRQLAQLAGWLQDRDSAQQRLSDEVRERMRSSVSALNDRSIVDALDFVGEAPLVHSQLASFSEDGLARLRVAAAQLAYLRSRAGLPLSELVRLVIQELLLDIEVVANETSGLGMANLYAFQDELVAFVASDDQASLGAFLAWLDRAQRQDMMGPRREAEEPGTVQLLTIHGSKGLEWDVVAVPRMVSAELPAPSKEGLGWLRPAQLPYEFR